MCGFGYGPQEKDAIEKKNAFWDRLSNEADDPSQNDAGFILQMDGNLWAGSEVVKDDPNECNQNGKLFKTFLKNNPHLHVVNSLNLCEGKITRIRITIKKEEKSILDFFVVCSRVLGLLVKMVIDEEKQYALSNYSSSGGIKHRSQYRIY